MKKIILIAIIISIGCGMNAQDYVPTRADLETFFKTKTLVVLEDNPLLEYNLIIKDVIEREWTLTEYDFINMSEFEEKRTDPQYSFLLMTKVSFAHDKTDAEYKFLHCFLGGDYFRVNQMPDICAVPVSFKNVGEEYYIYKLGILVRFMQNHITLINENPDIISANVFKHYNNNIANIKGKTLYLLEDELEKSVNSAARIKKIYPEKFKIVTREDIEEAITNREDDVVFLHKVGPEGTKINARCYKVLIGAGDAKFYYFDYHKIDEKQPDGFLESDFKKLARKLD